MKFISVGHSAKIKKVIKTAYPTKEGWKVHIRRVPNSTNDIYLTVTIVECPHCRIPKFKRVYSPALDSSLNKDLVRELKNIQQIIEEHNNGEYLDTQNRPMHFNIVYYIGDKEE